VKLHLKCTWQQKFLLAILNLGMISSVSVKKIFNLVKSFHFYGGLKLAFNGPCPPWQGVWVYSPISDVTQGSRHLALIDLDCCFAVFSR
jgi:hypothetical protein